MHQLETEQCAALQQLQAAVDAGDRVRLSGDRLEILPHDALPDDPAVARLQAHVERLRPHAEITDVLADVDAWTEFSGQLSHAAGATPRVRRLGEHLHAALLAWGMNLGPTRMAESCQLSYRQLAWATEWYLCDDNLQAANAVLVDYLRQLELAAPWGTGTFSSSDGQRSPARGRAAAADPAAREFGYRRGALTVLNWTSDQYSQYGTKVVSVAEREAVHTLEAILHTSLEIREHTTDTHGATVMWTAGCVKGRRHQLSAGLSGSPSSSRRCARRAAVQRWRSTLRGRPRCSASSARRSSVSRRVRSLGA